MKRILIVCAGGLEATNPGTKEMVILANELSKNFDVSFLTTYLWKSQRRQSEKFKTIYIKSPRYSKFRYFKRLQDCKSAPLEFLLKLYNKLFKCEKDSNKPFYSWLKRQKETYDLIISISHPFYNHEYANAIKERLSIENWFLMILDPYADGFAFSRDCEEKAKIEREYFQKSKKIFTTCPIFENAKISPIKEFGEKVSIIPDVFITDKTHYNNVHSDGTIRLGYFGMFYHDIRSPEPFLKMLRFLPENYLTQLYFKGCENLVKSAVQYGNIKINDMISDPEEYNKVAGKINIFISIGNSVINQIPSKLYDCVSFGKPIIHFYQDKNDFVIKKFLKYPGIRFIDYSLDPQTALKEFIKACEELKDFRIEYSTIKTLFPDDTIDFLTDCLGMEIYRLR